MENVEPETKPEPPKKKRKFVDDKGKEVTNPADAPEMDSEAAEKEASEYIEAARRAAERVGTYSNT